MKNKIIKKANQKNKKRINIKANKRTHSQAHKRPVKQIIKKAANRPLKKLAKKELAEFRKIVLKKKETLIEDLNHISEDTLKKSQKEASGDISGYTYHMADVATDNYDREFSLDLASGERKSLYELEDALKRIEEGSFGFCDQCKRPISKLRLKALPSARLCVKCQESLEKR
ncbi:MAG: TraR/DksA family transcriptional regulator [Candidatus Omnitrophica bacterium]|nr:TraR/DksA family transcriptional regulator [Candidatus Omnitrophota bacterium]